MAILRRIERAMMRSMCELMEMLGRVTHFARPMPNFPSVKICMLIGLLYPKLPKKFWYRITFDPG